MRSSLGANSLLDKVRWDPLFHFQMIDGASMDLRDYSGTHGMFKNQPSSFIHLNNYIFW